MQQLKNIRWLPIVMLITILGITAFHLYWLNDTYKREKWNLERMSSWTFRDVVNKLLASKLKLDSLTSNSDSSDRDMSFLPRQKMIGLLNVLKEKAKDPSNEKNTFSSEQRTTKGDRG